MKQPAVLVIDIGTTLIKVSLFDFRCRLIDRVSRGQNRFRLEVPFDAEGCWRAVAVCSAELTARNAGCQIAVVGITGFMHLVVALDRAGLPLPLTLPDAAVRECFERMLSELGFKRIYQSTGSRLDTSSVPPVLTAFHKHHPDAFARIATLLPAKDFIRYRITNEIATDEIDACGTMLYDVHQRRWDTSLLSYCELREEMLPPVLHCTARGGIVTATAAKELQIPAGTPVAVGGGDDIEILGCGAVAGDQICEHVGSTGSFLLHTQTARTDAKMRLEIYPAIEPGKWVLGGSCSNVTRALDWFLMTSAYRQDGAILWNKVQADLTEALGNMISERPLFLPYLHGERAPLWNSDLTAGWVGLRKSHTPADLLLAVLEGVCFSLRAILDVYKELGIQINSICSSGGLNQLDTTELRATVYGKPVCRVKGADPTSFAAAAIALFSIAELSDPREAAAWLEIEREVDPKPEWADVLGRRFELFSEATAEMLIKVANSKLKQEQKETCGGDGNSREH